jgi:hypothetical protein
MGQPVPAAATRLRPAPSVGADGAKSFELMQQVGDRGTGALVYFALDLLDIDDIPRASRCRAGIERRILVSLSADPRVFIMHGFWRQGERPGDPHTSSDAVDENIKPPSISEMPPFENP